MDPVTRIDVHLDDDVIVLTVHTFDPVSGKGGETEIRLPAGVDALALIRDLARALLARDAT